MPEGRIDVMGVSDAEAPPRLPELGAVGALRWVWRQLTSMRVALMLLMLLAVVAVPGSVLPQRPQDPAKVATYLADNPGLGPWLDRLGLFDVYASVWFSAVYLLLFVSLIGCIVPRVAMHGRALRARPPRAPRGLDRFTAEFTPEARPVDFAAEVAVREPGSPARAAVIRVNHPLSVGGANVYLQGNGYAPDVVVRDAAGEVAFAGAVPFLPQDAVYTSRGVIKVPDVSTGDQIGIVGFLLPTAVVTPAGAY